jgi:hypothetical protein
MWKGCIPSVCLLHEFSNLQTTLSHTYSNTIGVGINLKYVDNVCCATYCKTIYMTRWSICYGTWLDFSSKIMFLESLKHNMPTKKCWILTNKSVKNMTQTLLAVILQRILLNRVQEENVKIIYIIRRQYCACHIITVMYLYA